MKSERDKRPAGFSLGQRQLLHSGNKPASGSYFFSLLKIFKIKINNNNKA